jgi:hypothetical protein
MAYIGQFSLPQEFFDTTSSDLLTQPEPQYLYCQAWKRGLNVAFQIQAERMGIAPYRAIPDQGAAYLQNPEVDRLMFSDPIMDAMVLVQPDLGKAPGDTIRINRPSFTDSTYTLAARTVPSGTIISTTPIAVASEQTYINILRLGGPYDNTQAAIAPYGVERFDAGRMIHSAADITGLHLKRDFDKFIDAVMVFLYDQLSTTVLPAGMINKTTPVVPGDFPMGHQVLADVEQSLRDNHVPMFPGGKYVGVITTRQANQLQQDKQFLEMARYNQKFNPQYAGSYWADYGVFKLYQSTTLTIDASGATVPGGTTNTEIYNGHFFGPGVVGSGVGELPQVWPSTNDNYGQLPLVIWLMNAGFAVFDARLGAIVSTS